MEIDSFKYPIDWDGNVCLDVEVAEERKNRKMAPPVRDDDEGRSLC